MHILLLFSILVFVTCGIVFNFKLKKNQTILSNIESYKGINWSSMYIDGAVQINILKNIFLGKTETEKELKAMLLISFFSFMVSLLAMLYFLLP